MYEEDELQVAFGPDGSPSKALLGFCKKNGVQADSVFVEADAKGTKYVWAVVKQPGEAAIEVQLVDIQCACSCYECDTC